MTLSLRRKRPITAAARSTPARTAAKLLGLGLLLAGSTAHAQAPAPGYPPPPMAQSPYYYSQQPSSPASSLPAEPPPVPRRSGNTVPAPGPVIWHSADGSRPAPSPYTPINPPSSEPAAMPPATAPMAPVAPMVTPPNVRSVLDEPRPPMPVVPAMAMQKVPPTTTSEGRLNEENPEYQIQLEPPGPDRLFQLESERSLQEHMRQEARQRPTLERILFPEEPQLAKEPFTPRAFPPFQEIVEANYVCYGRLYFEEKNSERYGWDLGIVQPFVSAGAFYLDVLTLPYHLGTEPCRRYECSAGYCQPGDPVPYLLYPPELSVTGAVLEAGAIVAILAIFPG